MSAGPWKAANKACWFRGQRHEDDGKITISAGEQGVVANVYGRQNARLVAAAPDLLAAAECSAALEMLPKDGGPILERHGWDQTENPHEFAGRLRDAAVAKATGVGS